MNPPNSLEPLLQQLREGIDYDHARCGLFWENHEMDSAILRANAEGLRWFALELLLVSKISDEHRRTTSTSLRTERRYPWTAIFR